MMNVINCQNVHTMSSCPSHDNNMLSSVDFVQTILSTHLDEHFNTQLQLFTGLKPTRKNKTFQSKTTRGFFSDTDGNSQQLTVSQQHIWPLFQQDYVNVQSRVNEFMT